MKKFTKLFVAALCLVLLVGAIVGVSVTAAEEEEPTYQTTSTKVIVSSNVSYAGRLHLCLAIDPTLSAFMVQENGKEVYSDGNIDLVTCTINGRSVTLTPSEEKTTLPNGRSVYIVEAPGIAPKDILTPITVNVKLSGENGSRTTTDGVVTAEDVTTKYYQYTETFTIAEYFYHRLYKDGIIDATTDTELDQKELYLATLAYASAAQELLAPEATNKISEQMYVWGDADVVADGLVEKGERIKLDGKAYSLEYYSLDGVIGSDITAGAGGYNITCTTKVELAKETVVAPEGALTFGDKAEGDYVSADDDNALIITSGQAHPLQYLRVSKSSAANDNIGTLIYDKTEKIKHGSSNGGSWIILKNNSGVVATEEAPLVFEARMNAAVFNGTAPYFRIYGADRYTKPTGGTRLDSGTNKISTYSADGWYTFKVVMTPSKAVIYVNGAEKGTLTLNGNATPEVIQFQTNSNDYVNLEFEYIYFGAEPATAAVCTPFEPTRNCDVDSYSDAAVRANVLAGGASYVVGNASYDSACGYIKSEEGNKYLSYEDKNSSGGGQGYPRFANTNDLTDKNTLTFSFKMRINAFENGTIIANSTNSGIDLRIRGKNTTSASNNLAQAMLYAVDGKVAIVDYMGQKERGDVLQTDIDASEWFTVTITYTDNAETATYTISSGEKSYTLVAGTLEGYRCAVAEMKDFTLITMTSFVGIWDIDEVSITASKV